MRLVDSARTRAGRAGLPAAALRRLGPVPAAALGVVLVFVALAVFPDQIAPHDPYATSLPNRLLPPAWLDGGSSDYLLGTDAVGRDVLSRLIHGARASLLVATQAIVVGLSVGTAVALVAGFFGGWIDAILMRLVDVTLALPIILFALLFVVVLGPAMSNVVIAIGLVLWARFARVIRGEVLTVRESAFVASARVSGASTIRIMRRHLLPNVTNVIVVMASLQVGYVIIVEAALSFLGAGVPLPTPAWGSMIAEGRDRIVTEWWLTLWPGMATMLVVLAFNFFGDWLRDTLDPRLRQI